MTCLTGDLYKAGMRKIRNIEFNYEDCEALLNPGTKLKGPAIDALGALFQQQAEQGPDVVPDWFHRKCIYVTVKGRSCPLDIFQP